MKKCHFIGISKIPMSIGSSNVFEKEMADGIWSGRNRTKTDQDKYKKSSQQMSTRLSWGLLEMQTQSQWM
jgi:hypothetical protein